MSIFDYNEAFSRNIGWVTEAEQQRLSRCRVAIAGLGGVGFSHALTLARLGIQHFSIADFDQFELANFNRQAGAYTSTMQQPKAAVLKRFLLDLNPQASVELFSEGVNESNIDNFFLNSDIYVDGLDFFAVHARRLVFAYCHQHAIPAVTAAPLGMGVAVLNFLPGCMSFEEYFRLDNHSEQEQLLRFLIGLSPARLHVGYLVDRSRVDFNAHKGPSTAIACELCAGVAAAQTLKVILGRGKLLAAPHGLHFDAYSNKLAHTWRPWGNNNPLQKLTLWFLKRYYLPKMGSSRSHVHE